MDDLDRQIVTELQMDFPLESDPYEVVARKLGIDLENLFQRVQILIDLGTIRRVGVSIDSRKMGYASTLAAVRVTDDRVDFACQVIDSLPQITHSYLRSNEFNVWFTVITTDPQEIENVLLQVRNKLEIGASDVLNLPVLKLFKLDARFKPTK